MVHDLALLVKAVHPVLADDELEAKTYEFAAKLQRYIVGGLGNHEALQEVLANYR